MMGKVNMVKIVPGENGRAIGTKVLTADGLPIKHVNGLTVRYPLGGAVTAEISIGRVEQDEYMANPLFDIPSLEKMAACHGMKLVPDPDSGCFRLDSEWVYPSGGAFESDG